MGLVLNVLANTSIQIGGMLVASQEIGQLWTREESPSKRQKRTELAARSCILKIICKVRGPVEIFTIPRTNNIFTYCCANATAPPPPPASSWLSVCVLFGPFFLCLYGVGGCLCWAWFFGLCFSFVRGGLLMIYHRRHQSYILKIKTRSAAFSFHPPPSALRPSSCSFT